MKKKTIKQLQKEYLVKALPLVIQEVTMLKQHATETELNRLDINNFNPNNERFCIYGLLTGNCFEERAVELLNTCTKPFTKVLDLDSYEDYVDFEDKIGVRSTRQDFDDLGRDFSPLEFYIMQTTAENNEKVFQYLKGEIEELDITLAIR